MDRTVSDPNFAGMAVFTPVINGEFLSILVLQLLADRGIVPCALFQAD